MRSSRHRKLHIINWAGRATLRPGQLVEFITDHPVYGAVFVVKTRNGKEIGPSLPLTAMFMEHVRMGWTWERFWAALRSYGIQTIVPQPGDVNPEAAVMHWFVPYEACDE